MITDERITCSTCKKETWWRSWDKRQPYIGAIKAGWRRHGVKFTCPECLEKEWKPKVMHRTKFPIKFKRTK